MITDQQTQLDRIEAKLNEFLELKTVLLKLALPKVPEKMREQVLRHRAGRQDWDD